MVRPQATRLVVPAAVLLRAAASNSDRSPLLPHHARIMRARGYGELITAGELWLLDALLQVQSISPKQDQRLRDIELKIERARPC